MQEEKKKERKKKSSMQTASQKHDSPKRAVEQCSRSHKHKEPAIVHMVCHTKLHVKGVHKEEEEEKKGSL